VQDEFDYLHRLMGPSVQFRLGQQEAIHDLTKGNCRLLVIQTTGWGKSLVYFISTRILRDQGAGPTLIISPLLALMRNQIESARRLGLHSATLNSANQHEWEHVTQSLIADQVDVLFIAPERLARPFFRESILRKLPRPPGLLVIDEAHCISDWGHDFRPDYRRIHEIIRDLPERTSVLATTATADNRVISDICTQLDSRFEVRRGPLMRSSLQLTTIRISSLVTRFAWLAYYIPKLQGSGIIYCLTVRECQLVADWLQECSINAKAYYAALPDKERSLLEQQLLGNQVRVLVSTVALGMGFDKPDLGFVIHLYLPPSAVAYYQQVGRAGRAIDSAWGILLFGCENERIEERFIHATFPTVEEADQVIAFLVLRSESTFHQLEQSLPFISPETIRKILTIFEIDGIVSQSSSTYRILRTTIDSTLRSWEDVMELRRHDWRIMQTYAEYQGCLMEFLADMLDDPHPSLCGRCSNCIGKPFPIDVPESLIQTSAEYLGISLDPLPESPQSTSVIGWMINKLREIR
jgi:ATP-dependent DNA helicase RecQ